MSDERDADYIEIPLKWTTDYHRVSDEKAMLEFFDATGSGWIRDAIDDEVLSATEVE